MTFGFLLINTYFEKKFAAALCKPHHAVAHGILHAVLLFGVTAVGQL